MRRLWIASLLPVLIAAPSAARAGVNDVKVVTDTSIDCSSMATIARDLYRDCKTDQDKAIATWYFVRRMHFHWPHIPTWDSIDLINSYGFALCGYQSTMYCQIAAAGRLKARTMHPQRHVIAEAFYDGAWHMFDCQVGWYALNRKGQVASCAELKADPTLVTKAIEEGRASKPYFQCRDNPKSGTNYAATARTGRTLKPPAKRLVINLRRGESITRTWANEGKSWHKAGETKWTAPHHGCLSQTIDTNDPVNWPYWKPYAKVARVRNGKPIYGWKRYYGNGRTVYAPDLSADHWADALVAGQTKNVEPAKGLRPARPGRKAKAVFTIDLPYVGVDAWLDAAIVRKTDADAVTIYAKGPKGGWKKVWSAEKTGVLKLEKVSLKDAAWFGHGYQVKFEMTAAKSPADAGVRDLRITSVFMNNMYALPFFKPGKNVVRVTAAKGADLAGNKLTLKYVWAEAGKDKTLEKTIGKAPFETTVRVAGPADGALPRMKSVTLSVAP